MPAWLKYCKIEKIAASEAIIRKISKKNLFILILIGLLLLFVFLFLTVITMIVPKKIFAFPGAEGFGAYVSGGRGGAVYHVTSLLDTNSPGTLRYAINQKGARTIVFDVSGLISLKSPLVIKNGDITIAGQSAPGTGICIRNFPLVIEADNVIIRYMRFRLGNVSNNYSLSVQNRQGIIIDHCSISWATRQNVNMTGNALFTMQWCIISEALNATSYGVNGGGARLGGLSASFHHNLFISNARENPYFIEYSTLSKSITQFVDFRNNVIINWQDNSSEGLVRGAFNVANNYYRYGPATIIPVKSQIIRIFTNQQKVSTVPDKPTLCVTGNYVFNNPLHTNDNWMGVYPNKSYIINGENKILTWRQFFHAPLTVHSAERSYKNVLKYAGASKRRDDVDIRLVNSAIKNKYKPLKGIINSPAEVGGYKYKAYRGIKDTDRDGIPDYWEKSRGLDPKKRSDGQLRSKSNPDYTNLEMYLNSSVEEITKNQNAFPQPTKDLFWLLMLKYVNWVKKE